MLHIAPQLAWVFITMATDFFVSQDLCLLKQTAHFTEIAYLW